MIREHNTTLFLAKLHIKEYLDAENAPKYIQKLYTQNFEETICFYYPEAA